MCAQWGSLPLHSAVQYKSKDCLEILLLNGSEKDAKMVVSDSIFNFKRGKKLMTFCYTIHFKIQSLL